MMTLSPAIGISVLDNNWDDDGDVLTVTIVDPSRFGNTEVNADGSVTYTSNGIYCGVLDIFLYEVCDTTGACDQALVHVTNLTKEPTPLPSKAPSIAPTPLPTNQPTRLPTRNQSKVPTKQPTNPPTPMNNPSKENGDYVTVQCGGTIEVPVLINDFDPDGDSLTITIVSEPCNGDSDINAADSTISYTSNGDVCDEDDIFSYLVCDDSGSCDNAIVRIFITNPPVANDDLITTLCETPIHVPVMINDYHPDGLSITITIMITYPSNGNVDFDDEYGTITYTSDESCVEMMCSHMRCTTLVVIAMKQR